MSALRSACPNVPCFDLDRGLRTVDRGPWTPDSGPSTLLMASPRDIRRRIRSIRNTAQITKAMQMVAASKMRKAQEAALAIRPFARLLYRVQRKATTQSIDFSHPLLEVRPVTKRAIILVGGDKGLCGALNSNLFRVASQFDPRSTVFITAGRRSAQFVARTRRATPKPGPSLFWPVTFS